MDRRYNMHRKNDYKVLVAEPEGMSVLERQQRILDDDIKIFIKFGKLGSINLAQDRDQNLAVVNTEINFVFCKMRRIF
jgi:hypothetical protein